MNSNPERRVRVLLAKVGLDGHDRGIKLLARYLMEAGMEVIYTGLRAMPETIAAAAAQEDVDVLGMSFLAGDHMILIPKVMERLKARGLDDIMVLAGGVILQQEVPILERMGVARVFLPGTPLESIAQFIENNVEPNTQKEQST
jgi:methylmalonyl-CoA mutase C-terminal domain/subunit